MAVDAEGKPSPVRPWQPETSDDQALEHYAIKLMGLREGIEAEMQAARRPD